MFLRMYWESSQSCFFCSFFSTSLSFPLSCLPPFSLTFFVISPFPYFRSICVSYSDPSWSRSWQKTWRSRKSTKKDGGTCQGGVHTKPSYLHGQIVSQETSQVNKDGQQYALIAHTFLKRVHICARTRIHTHIIFYIFYTNYTLELHDLHICIWLN